MDTRYRTRKPQRTRPVNGGRSGFKLLVSLVIFAGVVVCKLVFPTGSSAMREKLLPLISESIDYEAALTAAGRLLTGDEQALEDVKANMLPQSEAQPAAVPEVQIPVKPEPTFLQATRMAAWARLDADRAQIGTLLAASAEPEVAPAVAAFLESQLAFSDLDVPVDVDLSMPDLPFQYDTPVAGYSSSGFGYREHPIDEEVRYHYGTDIAANLGEYIHSFADGVVYATGEGDSTGKYIMIDHGDGYMTQYFHCNDVYVYGGEVVERGQVIGEVGESGYATGPHLHFELLLNDTYLNPEYYLGVWG